MSGTGGGDDVLPTQPKPVWVPISGGSDVPNVRAGCRSNAFMKDVPVHLRRESLSAAADVFSSRAPNERAKTSQQKEGQWVRSVSIADDRPRGIVRRRVGNSDEDAERRPSKGL